MSAAPAQPVFRDAAHRRAAMRSLVWRLPVVTLLFVILGPLIGMAILFAPSVASGLVMAPAGTIGAAPFIALAVPSAYYIGVIPAAFSGFWVTLLATFTNLKKQLYAGSAAIGATSTWLFSTAMTVNSEMHGSPDSGLILVALGGAAAALTCTFIFRNWPLGPGAIGPFSFESRNHRRNRLAKARAERLAKAREKA